MQSVTSTLVAVKVYLIRHASAVSEGPKLTDEARYLSADGRQQCRGVARLMREQGITFDAVITSPLVRAVQTAELIADGVDFLGQVEAHYGLYPGSHPSAIANDIGSLPGDVALVGHAPTISMLGAHLVGQPGFAPFRTCQIVMLENRVPQWTLRADAMQFEDWHLPG